MEYVSSMQASCIHWYRWHTIAITATAAAITAHATVIMHIASKLFSLRFVFVVLLIIQTAIACINICDTFATAAITITARRNEPIKEEHWQKKTTY